MNIAVIGGGKIIPEFLSAARDTDGISVCGIWARRAEVREKIAAEWHLPHVYDTCEELLADPQVDAVYLAITNHVHVPYALQILNAGKDVLLEKPITVTLQGAQEIFSCAKRNGCHVFEMITNRYCPAFAEVQAALPKLGTPRLAVFNYSQYSSRYERFLNGIIEPVFDPEKAGGALLDLNVYNIHLAVGWFGSPKKVHYSPNIVRGVDTSGIVLMEYDDFCCVCIGAKDCEAPAGFTLQGDCGYIHSDAAPSRFFTYSICPNGQAPQSVDHTPSVSRMCDELAAYRDHALAHDDAWFDEQDAHSLRVMAVVDAALRSGGLHYGGQ